MIIDLRIYTCLPNKVADFVALYEKEGWDIQKKHLGRCYGWFTTIEGELNTIVHMWAYDDQADRERRRAAMAADPAWAAYLKKVAETGALVQMPLICAILSSPTRSVGIDRPVFIAGSSDWPPARKRPSSPAPIALIASATDAGL